MLLAEAVAFAQGPGPMNPGGPPMFGNPGAFGYPGYPAYGPAQPMQPMLPPGYNPAGPGMAPNVPYGYGPSSGPVANPYPMGPMPAPGGPFVNPGPMGPMPGPGGRSLPTYDGFGPKEGANEPYVVPRDAPPPAPNPVLQPAPSPFDSRPPIYGPPAGHEPACYIQAVPPSEPYALYEGPRSAAEVKVEDTCVWLQASFVHWWVNRGNVPPLVTTGSLNDPMAGALGQPSTGVLLGNGPIGPNEFSGIQASLGMWVDPEKTHAFELAGFYVGNNSRQYSVSSDANGNPLLAQPLIVTGVGGGEFGLVVSQPGALAASIHVNEGMSFYGAEANWIINAYRLNGWTFDYFAGARYLYLNDTLSVNQNITLLPGGAGFIPFNGVAQPAGSIFNINDSFNATNRFYGGQVGARINWTSCNWEFGAVMKLGLGATNHNVVIDGSTTLNTGGTTTTVSGGSLAQASNIGTHSSTDVSVVPELNLSVSYQFTCWFRVIAGYNLLYWTNVERAGSQIDRRIDFTQVPTSPTFVPGAVGANPIFPNARSDFWAQGLYLGVECKVRSRT